MSDLREPTPYAPPASMLSEPPLDPAELGAGHGRRFFNLVIDQFALGVVLGGVTALAAGAQAAADVSILESLLGTFLYYAVLETLFGRTLGKLVTGTRVVAVDGSRPGSGQILGRTLARFIPFEPLSVLFGGAPPVGWHDSLSGTRVIRLR